MREDSGATEPAGLRGTLTLLRFRSADPIGSICDGVCMRVGALRIDREASAVSAWFDGARRALSAAVELVRANPDRIAAGFATADIENPFDLLQLTDEAAGIAGLAEPGQVLLSHTALELVRAHAGEQVFFNDLGTRSVGVSMRPVRVFILSMAGLYSSSLPREATARPGNPPDFVGRTFELSSLVRLLDQRKLVTIVGPRGIGKTALASRLELEAAEGFRGGTTWVDLRQVARSSLLLHSIAAAMEIHSIEEGTLFEQIAAKIGEASRLLVFDGADLVRAAASNVAERLLSSCPNLAIVATSLRKLSSASETVFPIAGLEVPTDGTPASIAKEFDAVLLFTAAARVTDPDFEIDGHNAGSICSIVEILEGSPWAIKLAASRMSVLSPLQLLARIRDDPLALLTDRTKPGQNGTTSLRRALQANLDSLSPWARVLFRRCGIFRGPFSSDALGAVCAALPELPKDAVLAALGELLDVHLLQPYRAARLSRAFFLSPVSRELSLEQMRAEGEAATITRLHDLYIKEAVERLMPSILMGHARALEEFDLIYEEVRESWLAGFRSRKWVGEAFRSMIGCSGYWFQRGFYAEGLELTGTAEKSAWMVRSPDYPRLVNLSAWCALRSGNFGLAKLTSKRAVRVAFEMGSEVDHVRALNTAGSVATELLRFRTAARCLKQACMIVRELEDSKPLQSVFANYAAILSELGRVGEAAKVMDEIQDEEIGPGRWSNLTYLTNRAHLMLAEGEIDRSWEYLRSACEQYAATPDPLGLATMYAIAAWAAHQGGEVEEARILASAHAAIVEHFGLLLSPRQSQSKERLEWLTGPANPGHPAWDSTSPVEMILRLAIPHVG